MTTNEIQWKWELLCDAFDHAKQNYIQHFSPLMGNVRLALETGNLTINVAEIDAAEDAWKQWVDVQQEIKLFIESAK